MTIINTPAVTATPTSSTGKSQYDIKREAVNVDAERQRQLRQDALKRQLASQNMSNSGVALKESRNLATDVAKQAAAERSNIDVAELAAKEQSQEAEKARQWQTGERTGAESFSRETMQNENSQRALDRSHQLLVQSNDQTGAQALEKLRGNIQQGLQTDQQTYDAAKSALDRAWDQAKQANDIVAQKDIETLRQTMENARQSAQIGFQRETLTNENSQRALDRAHQLLVQSNDQTGAQALEKVRGNVQQGLQTDQHTYDTAKAALDRAHDLAIQTNDLTAKKEIETLQMVIERERIASGEKIAGAEIASREKIAADENAIKQQGLTLQQAELQGYTDPITGKHVKGTLEIKNDEIGIQAKTFESAEKELWGWTDEKGVTHPGKYDMMTAEQKQKADQLYGYQDKDGNWVMGSLEIDKYKADMEPQLIKLRAAAEMDTLTFRDMLDQKVEERKATSDRYYNQGLSGTKLSDTELANLKTTNSMAYNAYLSGVSGKAVADYKREQEVESNYEKARALEFSNLVGTPYYKDQIDALYNELSGGKIGKSSVTTPAQTAGQSNSSNKSVDMSGSWKSTTDLVGLVKGQNIYVPTSTKTTKGQEVPPGSYKVEVVNEKRKTWTNEVQGYRDTPKDVTYLVDKNDPTKRYEVEAVNAGKQEKEKGFVDYFWNNKANPLSSDFWDTKKGGISLNPLQWFK